MNIELERQHIIEELSYVKDEWVIRAIKRILAMEDESEVSEEHKQILDARIRAVESGTAKTPGWEDAKKSLSI